MKSGLEISLSGSDRRSIGDSNKVANAVRTQQQFDELFKLLFHKDRLIVMRAADATEKVTRKHPEYLDPHRAVVLDLAFGEIEKELQWHVAQLLPRLKLKGRQYKRVVELLKRWSMQPGGSRIVRVNSLQGLFDMITLKSDGRRVLEPVLKKLEKEGIPSLSARCRILRKSLR